MTNHTCADCGAAFKRHGGPGRPRIRCFECSPRQLSCHICMACISCGADFEAVTHSAKYCSQRCRDAAKPRIPCSECGEPSGYSLYQRNIDASKVRCLLCRRANPVVVHGSETSYNKRGCRCSECRDGQARRMREYAARRRAQGNPIRPKRPTEVRTCEHCASSYEVGKYSPNRFCSLDCANAKQRADAAALVGEVAPPRKRKKQSFTISRTARLAIYERDNWTCQICDEPIDRDAHYMNKWAATLDHIIPQSRQLVPDHSPKNLRLVHRRCNVIRGNLTHYSTDEAVRMRKEAS